MLTSDDLLRAVLVPALVAGAVAAVGWWRRWDWAMPAAAGLGFLAGHALLGVPGLPPRDGTDWLFWLAIPVTLLGVMDSVTARRWGGIMGAAAGAVAYLVVRPLPAEAVSAASLYGTALGLAVAGAAVVVVVGWAEPRVGTAAVVAGLCVALGAAAVVVLS